LIMNRYSMINRFIAEWLTSLGYEFKFVESTDWQCEDDSFDIVDSRVSVQSGGGGFCVGINRLDTDGVFVFYEVRYDTEFTMENLKADLERAFKSERELVKV